ncbi:unnamed protein product [Sympodiomycopsis kandeliae]
MPATLAPHPSLSAPVLLGSYSPAPAHSRAHSSLVQTQSSSSSRQSFTSLGEVVRISSGSVRRARGLVATVAAGQSVTLYETSTHTALQSFPLAQNVQPCTPPLTVIRSWGSTKQTIRTTYLGVAGQDASAQTEIWAWSEVTENHSSRRDGDEQASSRSPANPSSTPHRATTPCNGKITSLHPLASGEVLLRSDEGSLSLLTPRQSDSATPTALELNIRPVTSDSESSSKPSSRSMVHHTSLLDPAASIELFGGRLPRENISATILTFTSQARLPASSLAKPAAAATPTTGKKGRRKTAIEVIDDAEKEVDKDGLVAFGELSVQISMVLEQAGESNSQPSSLVNGPKIALSELGDSSQILDFHFYHSGELTMLDRSGMLSMTQLQVGLDLQASISPSRTINVAHINSSQAPSRPASVIRLSASHILIILVAQGGPTNGRLTALIWDSELQALLVTFDWTLPSTHGLPESERKLSVSATRVGRSQVLVQSIFWGNVMGEEMALATLWALPFTIPDGSVLRHAIGKAALTSMWTKSVQSHDKGVEQGSSKTAVGSTSGLSGREADLVHNLVIISGSSGTSAEKRAAEMETKFTAWISEETHRLRQIWEQDQLRSDAVRQEDLSAKGGQSDSDDSDDDEQQKDAVEQAEAGQQDQRNKHKASKVPLSHSFVTALINVALPTSKSQRPYARKIVAYLVERRSVSCGMLSGSEQTLLARLQAVPDWDQIMSVVRTVGDLGEVELVGLLRNVLQAQRGQGSNEDAEGKTKPPSLDVFLSQFMTLAVSRPLLRSKLYGSVTDAKDVCLMLDTTTQWLKARYYEPLDIDRFVTSAGDNGSSRSSRRKRLAMEKHQQGITIAGIASAKAPPTKDLLQFATDLVDIYFPLLLNTTSTHRSLRALSQAITAHLTVCDDLNDLRGPLDAYAKLESDRQQLAEEIARRSAMERFRDPRKSRPASQQQQQLGARAETGGGMQLPDINKSARLRAFEASALVGPHTVETLEI